MYNYLSNLFLTGCLLVAGLLLVVGCTPAELSANPLEEEASAVLAAERADAASVARWDAMGEFYSQLASIERQAALDAGAAHSVTMDQFYAKANAGEAANWQEVVAPCPDFSRLDYYYACRDGGWLPAEQ